MTDQEFETHARAYGEMIFRVALHALGCRADAEDVCQSALLKLYETGKVFESDAHVKHWLIRVTVNECRRLLRSPWRRRSVPLEDWDGPTPEGDDHSDVLDAVMALPAKYRVAVYLYYFEGLSVKELAEVTGVGTSTVQTRLQRARERLKHLLREEKTEGTDYV